MAKFTVTIDDAVLALEMRTRGTEDPAQHVQDMIDFALAAQTAAVKAEASTTLLASYEAASPDVKATVNQALKIASVDVKKA